MIARRVEYLNIPKPAYSNNIKRHAHARTEAKIIIFKAAKMQCIH